VAHSIWKEQIDTALIELIRNTITVTDYILGEKVPINEKSVFIRKPEDDFQIAAYPSISVYSLYDIYSPERSVVETGKVISRDAIKKRIEFEPPKRKFTLTYQIDFWALKQTHMNEMTLQWLSKFTRYHNFNLKDESGEACNILMLQKWGQGLRKEDLIQGSERIFHSFLTYDFWAEISGETRKMPMVTDVEVVERLFSEMPVSQ
jgi:hypothetical protein